MKSPRRWPLGLIALPAAVAIWSGWVALGELCGFGTVHPLPGIVDSFTINTAITLPVGVEAYAAYALGAWLTPGTPERAKAFAKRSAIGALGLGMSGQVIYHLLSAAHATRAPWPVVVIVSCLPVVTLGFGTALAHLLRSPVAGTAPSAPLPVSDPLPTADEDEPDEMEPDDAPYIDLEAARAVFADDIRTGRVPGLRRIRQALHVGHKKAPLIQQALSEIVQKDSGLRAV